MDSYRLTLSQCSQLGDPERFWEVMQTIAMHVDSVEEACGRVMEIILDYLGCEFGIGLPRGKMTEYSTKTRICAPPGDWIVTCLTRRDAARFRSNLEKSHIDSKLAAEIVRAYGYGDSEMERIAAECIEFLSRQVNHIKSEEDRLIVVIYGYPREWDVHVYV